jgi:hypothetical protein
MVSASGILPAFGRTDEDLSKKERIVAENQPFSSYEIMKMADAGSLAGTFFFARMFNSVPATVGQFLGYRFC